MPALLICDFAAELSGCRSGHRTYLTSAPARHRGTGLLMRSGLRYHAKIKRRPFGSGTRSPSSFAVSIHRRIASCELPSASSCVAPFAVHQPEDSVGPIHRPGIASRHLGLLPMGHAGENYCENQNVFHIVSSPRLGERIGRRRSSQSKRPTRSPDLTSKLWFCAAAGIHKTASRNLASWVES